MFRKIHSDENISADIGRMDKTCCHCKAYSFKDKASNVICCIICILCETKLNKAIGAAYWLELFVIYAIGTLRVRWGVFQQQLALFKQGSNADIKNINGKSIEASLHLQSYYQYAAKAGQWWLLPSFYHPLARMSPEKANNYMVLSDNFILKQSSLHNVSTILICKNVNTFVRKCILVSVNRMALDDSLKVSRNMLV